MAGLKFSRCVFVVSLAFAAELAFASPQLVRLDTKCQSITGVVTIGDNEAQMRVRKKATLVATGAKQKIYVDRGGSASISGQDAEVYAEDGATVTLTGDGSTVYKQKDANVVSTGENTVRVVTSFDVHISDVDVQCRKL
jgi:hypothetical protein